MADNQVVQRLDYIDLAKGIGIILVVFGHALSKDIAASNKIWGIVRSLIYMVHMPLFFMISGYLFQVKNQSYRRSTKLSFIAKKAKQYLIPYISFNVILYATSIMVSRFPKIQAIYLSAGGYSGNVKEFIISVLTYINPVDGHLWFSYVIFIVFAIIIFVHRIDGKTLIVFYVLAAITWFFVMPEILWKTLRYLFIFQVGRIFGSNKSALDRFYRKKSIMMLLFIFMGSFIIFTYLRRSPATYYPQCIVQPLCEISGAMTIILLSKRVISMDQSLLNVLTMIGKESYGIYLLHQPFIVPVLMSILRKTNVCIFLQLTMSTAIGISIPLLLTQFIIKKNKVLRLFLLGD